MSSAEGAAAQVTRGPVLGWGTGCSAVRVAVTQVWRLARSHGRAGVRLCGCTSARSRGGTGQRLLGARSPAHGDSAAAARSLPSHRGCPGAPAVRGYGPGSHRCRVSAVQGRDPGVPVHRDARSRRLGAAVPFVLVHTDARSRRFGSVIPVSRLIPMPGPGSSGLWSQLTSMPGPGGSGP